MPSAPGSSGPFRFSIEIVFSAMRTAEFLACCQEMVFRKHAAGSNSKVKKVFSFCTITEHDASSPKRDSGSSEEMQGITQRHQTNMMGSFHDHGSWVDTREQKALDVLFCASLPILNFVPHSSACCSNPTLGRHKSVLVVPLLPREFQGKFVIGTIPRQVQLQYMEGP